jgi:regulator of sirC expression with transglutaminase-like and TPR domain
MTGEATVTLKALGAVADEELDLAEGALALAAVARPAVPLAPYRAHLAQLAHDVAPARSLSERIAALNAALFERNGYEGDAATYDDLDNANLIRVIDRRRGLPVALGILYLHAARAQGWRAEGLNFPGHFLLRLEDGRERAIVDPFHGGMIRSTADLRGLLKASAGAEAELNPRLYEAVSNRQVLLRLQNNVVTRLAKAEKYDEAVASIDAMILLAPRAVRLWFERGAYQAKLGNLGAAIGSLETFIARAESPGAKAEAAALLATLKRRLN